MQGSIRQRGSTSWEVRVYVGRDPVTAGKRYVAKTVRGGKRDAHRALASLAHDVNERSMTRSRATVGDLLGGTQPSGNSNPGSRGRERGRLRSSVVEEGQPMKRSIAS